MGERNRHLAGCVVMVCLVMVIAGCGGGDSNTDGSAGAPSNVTAPVSVSETSISKSAYSAKASAICAKAGAVIFNVLSSARPTAGNEAKLFARLTQSQLVPTVEHELSQLKALGAPQGDDRQVTQILNALSSGVAGIKGQAIMSLPAFGKPFVAFDSRVSAYGIDSCAFRFA